MSDSYTYATPGKNDLIVKGSVGIGITSATEAFDISGTARLRGIAQDNSQTRLMVTDVNGKVFWRDLFSVASDNLGNHTATQNILPSTDNSFNLGSSANSFKDVYLKGKLYLQGSQFLSVSNYNVSTGETTTVGRSAGSSITTGTANTFLGYAAGFSQTTAVRNTFLGNVSGYYNTSGFDNTFVGASSGVNNSTGESNTFMGSYSGPLNTTGSNNIFVGTATGNVNTSGSQNVFIGYNSGNKNTTSGGNTYIGYYAGFNATGAYNSFIGQNSGINVTTGYQNSFTGAYSGYTTNSGYSNLFSGYYAGFNNTTGYNNTFLGTNAGSTLVSIHDAAAIGNGATVTNNYGIVIGTSSNFVGIRTNAPAYPLHVQNAYTDGSTWFNASDKNLKKNFRTITDEGILDKLMSLKIEKWTYKADSANSDHIGPIAQDFNKTFKLGSNDKAISTVDEIGVALAAIQELNMKTEKLKELIASQQDMISSLLSKLNSSTELNTEKRDTGLELYQNAPNPFKDKTEIRMNIPTEIREAVLFIYDLQGKQVDKKAISERGKVSYEIGAAKLSAGMYLYTLLADDHSTEVKRMILTE